MKHAFNIYPALLVLIPVSVEETIHLPNQVNESECPLEIDGYFTSCPQTYWGKCLLKGDQKQLLFGRCDEVQICPIQTLVNGRLNILEPTKFKGTNYNITYVPVLN